MGQSADGNMSRSEILSKLEAYSNRSSSPYLNGFDLETLVNLNLNMEEEGGNISDNMCALDYSPTEPEVLISSKVYLFCSLVFIIMGLVGNTLSIIVFSSKTMRSVSSNVYLLVLALSDAFYLISVLLTRILTALRCIYFTQLSFDIFHRSTLLCKLLQYMLDQFANYSTCLILAFTVERYIACYHAIKFKEICTVRKAQAACLFLFILSAIAIAPYHFMYIGINKGQCTVSRDERSELIFTILYIIEAMVFRVIPVFVIAVINIFIIVKVTKMSRERKRRMAVNRVPNHCNRKSSLREDKHRQLTIMLILVSSSYIICYTPVLVHFVMWKMMLTNLIHIDNTLMTVMQNYARPMYIFGFAINFFLYTMSGRVFRDQLILLLCGKEKRPIFSRFCNEKTTETNVALTQPLTIRTAATNGKATASIMYQPEGSTSV